jgi:hypothetical protein
VPKIFLDEGRVKIWNGDPGIMIIQANDQIDNEFDFDDWD